MVQFSIEVILREWELNMACKSLRVPLAVLLALCVSGCSDGDSEGSGTANIYSCDLRATQGYCQEYTGLDADGATAAYESSCPSTWLAQPCPRGDSVGGCGGPVGDGFTFSLVSWFYSGGTYGDAAQLETECKTGGDSYFAP